MTNKLYCILLSSLSKSAAHHWSPLSAEVEFVRTQRDVQQAIFDCAKDRHISPWVDVNARFGVIRYVEEKNGNKPKDSSAKD